MKKALSIALDLQCEEPKKIMDPLVMKHHGRPPIKRLKSSFESQNRNESAHTYRAINPRDMPFSNVDMNSHAINNTTEESCRENKRKYVCNICDEAGHNARTCKQQE
ncbi:hypothetical protein C2G38_2036704 [Gigaspora rosea]|uniref:CCHC-type domain-containing protein n=1 Tax=Gigaspora rosea TaxID=44941 RepID=A0A397V8E6_9GLOM|nr:hypothetical protein C2G38_2036704 [Gigaspora rosea]